MLPATLPVGSVVARRPAARLNTTVYWFPDALLRAGGIPTNYAGWNNGLYSYCAALAYPGGYPVVLLPSDGTVPLWRDTAAHTLRFTTQLTS